MQIVIDIPEKHYEEIKNTYPCKRNYEQDLILDGTPLPKIHGRLIDADAVKERMIPLSFSVQKWISEVDLDIYIPTIIEAESEEEE